MCGLVGIATREGDRPAVGRGAFMRMRDCLAHRGPDDAGVLFERNICLGHTRLAILDPSAGGRQPMRSACGRFTVVYNGEIYNDAELRAGLTADGEALRTGCDTETVLHLLAGGAERALGRLRGMYALALFDRDEQRLVIARDPLGIKPMYFWRGSLGGRQHVIFASEPTAILAHPGVSVRPDLAGISGYLTTIRTVQGERTMFEGVRAVRPGEWIAFDLRSAGIGERRGRIGLPAPACGPEGDEGERVRAVVGESAGLHLRSDVPMCSLLSGGLDSTIITSIAGGRVAGLMTYCAGAPGGVGGDDDLAVARVVAEELGVGHASVPVTRETFLERWPEMVGRLGVPLSTPNEVAINEVARRLRGDGYKVALSGEGADELFAGYDRSLGSVRAFLGASPGASCRERAIHDLESNSWVGPSIKPGVLAEGIVRRVGGDEDLIAWQAGELGACDDEAAEWGEGETVLDRRLRAHLFLQQRVNLVGLLGRLDTATMLASVEGRTPLADIAVGRLANGLPLERRIRWDGAAAATTKIALREAFGGGIPRVAVDRPKASFPLPFIGWLEGRCERLGRSELVGEVFAPGVVAAVSERPSELWRLAWPMLNLAMWGDVWWGNEKRPGVGPGVHESHEALA